MNKFFRRLKKVMLVVLGIVLVFFLLIWLFMQQDKFGVTPSKEDKLRYEQLFNYKDGKF